MTYNLIGNGRVVSTWNDQRSAERALEAYVNLTGAKTAVVAQSNGQCWGEWDYVAPVSWGRSIGA